MPLKVEQQKIKKMENTLITKFLVRNPTVLIFLGLLSVFTILVVVLAEGFGIGVISTSFVKTLGKTMCCLLYTSPSPRDS